MDTEEDIRFKREILGVAMLLSLASIYIIYPFLDAILLAVATAYILRFTHRMINGRLENEKLSTALIISGVLGILVLGIYFFMSNFVDVISGLNTFTTSIREGALNVIKFLELPAEFEQSALNIIDRLSDVTTSWVIGAFTAVPSAIINLGIFTVTSIYLYKDGEKVGRKMNEIVDDLPENERKIVRSLIRSIDSIFRGVYVTQFLVAAIIGLTTALGLYLISVLTSPIPLIPLWAVLIGIAALLPLIAAFMFYGPLGIYYLMVGEPVKGSLILAFGILVLNIMPEVLLRPYIGSRQMGEHPLIVFTGFIAGPLTLGLKGIVLGPVLLILTKEFIINYTDLVSG